MRDEAEEAYVVRLHVMAVVGWVLLAIGAFQSTQIELWQDDVDLYTTVLLLLVGGVVTTRSPWPLRIRKTIIIRRRKEGGGK